MRNNAKIVSVISGGCGSSKGCSQQRYKLIS